MKVFQKGFNYSQDGPGNRLVCHMQGCNMRCPWCSNPEGLLPEGILMTDEKWLEEFLCPFGAIKDKVLNRQICEQCESRDCVTRHRSRGIVHSCTEIAEGELAQEIIAGEMMFYDGGGVTFTGGECTLQFEELMQVLKLVKQVGINTCIETNGSHPHLAKLFPYVDHLIMDCKQVNGEKHRQWTGISNKRILENLELAAELHPSVHIRVPLIGGVNDSEEDMEKFLQFFDRISEHGTRKNVSFELLRYHEYGKKKWAACGWTYKMTEEAKIDAATVRAFIGRIREAGLTYVET